MGIIHYPFRFWLEGKEVSWSGYKLISIYVFFFLKTGFLIVN